LSHCLPYNYLDKLIATLHKSSLHAASEELNLLVVQCWRTQLGTNYQIFAFPVACQANRSIRVGFSGLARIYVEPSQTAKVASLDLGI
jgi:hypothetical protein